MHTAVDVLIPVFNESLVQVLETIGRIEAAFHKAGYLNSLTFTKDQLLPTRIDNGLFTIIVINDGSKPEFNIDKLKDYSNIKYLEHEINRGYGAALKSGVLSSDSNWIAITDADGTYPVEELVNLVDLMRTADLVVGTRTSEVNQTPWQRKAPKLLLNRFASYFAGCPIRDLNSGMRVFRRSLCYYLWPLFPEGFSFTSTLTMGGTLAGYRVKDYPINYFKREGSSSIQPIRDTIRFFRLVVRLGVLFKPKKLFYPIAALLGSIGAFKGAYDFFTLNQVGNFSVMFILGSLQITMLSLIADLIVQGRLIGRLDRINNNTDLDINRKRISENNPLYGQEMRYVSDRIKVVGQ